MTLVASSGARGFPAHAGMDPVQTKGKSQPSRLPRTRGDGPALPWAAVVPRAASPHTRGWTPRTIVARRSYYGFPAHAGMDPTRGRRSASPGRLPRTRGDGPYRLAPHQTLLSASPHTRGWTPRRARQCLCDRGFPAHAGMDPLPRPSRRCCRWLPRTRGDGPRARRTDPVRRAASPHTRGWTLNSPTIEHLCAGFPAHAGMDPRTYGTTCSSCGLPRTRGDGPADSSHQSAGEMASPHTRGWTHRHDSQHRALEGFPAHAGMDPSE